MGPPVMGQPLSWNIVQKSKSIARKRATDQLLNLWKRGLEIKSSVALWGDEVEHTLIFLDHESSRSTFLLDQTAVLSRWENQSKLRKAGLTAKIKSLNPWLQPEWARYMLESVPQEPHGDGIESLLKVESDLKKRRGLIQGLLHPNQHVVTISQFPCLGIEGQFTTPYYMPSQTSIHSRILPREISSPITRYYLLEENVFARRVHRVEVNVPIFRDIKTPWPFRDRPPSTALKPDTIGETGEMPELQEGCIYLDGVGFGPGSCCLQATFQVEDERTARWLHDQFIPLGPVMLALTTATPIYKGLLADSDARWNWISASLDDRMPQEKNSRPPRFFSNVTYVSQDERCRDEYMSANLPVDHNVKQQLVIGGMDERLAAHFAYILLWDPIYLNQGDMKTFYADQSNVFNAFQSGVWHHVRLKLPPPGCNDIGWRVEFRPMEVQVRDSENAAFLVFAFLLSRAIVLFELNFYVPIEKVRESMDVANKRNAVLSHRLWFRREGWSTKKLETALGLKSATNASTLQGREYALMTVTEIINGEEERNSTCAPTFPGLISIIWAYLDLLDLSASQKSQISVYLDVVSRRASGQLPTPAHWTRSFVKMHPAYRGDSIVHQKICYDLIDQIVRDSKS